MTTTQPGVRRPIQGPRLNPADRPDPAARAEEIARATAKHRATTKGATK